MPPRVSRVGVDHAALQQVLPLVPAAYFNTNNNLATTTQGVNALYDYILFLSGQQGRPLSSLGARNAYTALRNLLPVQLLGLPGNRLADVDREKAVILCAAGQYITALQGNQGVAAAATAAPVPPVPPPPPPPPPPQLPTPLQWR